MNTNEIWKEGVDKHIELKSQHERLEQRQRHCGGFMYRLIDTWYHADQNNKLILEKAFKGTAFDLT